MRLCRSLLLPTVGAALVASPALAQVEPNILPPGSVAPDFSLPGATRYGILRDPVRLSDYRGDVVVIGFFFRARTPG